MGEVAGDWMLVGTIAGSFGVRGELKVDLNTDFPDRFQGMETVYVGERHTPWAIRGARFHNGRVLLRLDGIETPEAGDKLRGTELWVPRSEAMPLPEGHYFLDDLLGIEVVSSDGRVLGPIVDVLRTGSNDVFVVGTGRAAILVPSIRDALREMNIAERRIVVEPWVLEIDG